MGKAGETAHLHYKLQLCILALLLLLLLLLLSNVRKILELEEELKVVGNAMKSLEIFEQEV